jgi:hypothetical protein
MMFIQQEGISAFFFPELLLVMMPSLAPEAW